MPCSLTTVLAQIQKLLCPKHVDDSEGQADAKGGLHELADSTKINLQDSSVLVDYSSSFGCESVSHVNSDGCEPMLMVWQYRLGAHHAGKQHAKMAFNRGKQPGQTG